MIYAENILICISVPLLVALIFIGGNARHFTASFLIGMIVCLLSAYISGFLVLPSGMVDEEVAIFISPMVEEIMKLLPLLFYLLMFQPDDESIYLSALGIGAGFATFENCCYILTAGADKLIYVMIRGMAVGVMHIVSILALALVICLARRFKAMSA
ncbi:MAG: PrsW family intramembrane metalloprotease, partial [Firmicutes bacterium]|nr:PrsW family intramembrane metalloprotease [Bacillota bacterium]